MTKRRDVLARLARVEMKHARFQRLLAAYQAKYDPNQPRLPAGQTGGGRWTNGAADAPTGRVSGEATAQPRTTMPRFDIDRTGEEPWRAMVADVTAEGDAIVRTIAMRDGARIHEITPTPGSDLGYDARHEVTTPDGQRVTFETTGPTQTIRDANDQAVARTTLTPDGLVAEPVVMAAASRTQLARGLIEAAAATLFGYLSSRNGRDSTAVFAIEATEGDGADRRAQLWTGSLRREELTQICPRAPEVQDITNRAQAEVSARSEGMDGGQFGSAVHLAVAREVRERNDPRFWAEVSFLNLDRTTQPQTDHGMPIGGYGRRGSIRVDILEHVSADTVCIYDIKTGRDGISYARYLEILGRAQRFYPSASRFRVIEVRAGR